MDKNANSLLLRKQLTSRTIVDLLFVVFMLECYQYEVISDFVISGTKSFLSFDYVFFQLVLCQVFHKHRRVWHELSINRVL